MNTTLQNLHFNELLKDRQSKEVREEVVRRYKDMVFQIANILGRNKKGENYMDLVQTGYAALLHAFDKFDTANNVKFITYAYKVVKGVMMTEISRDNVFGNRLFGCRASTVKNVTERLMTAKGVAPRDEVIAMAQERWKCNKSKVGFDKIIDTLEAINHAECRGRIPKSGLKINEKLRHNDATFVGDPNSTDYIDKVDTALDAAALWEKIERIRLTKKERYVFYEIMKNNRSNESLSQEMCLTVQRIRQLYQQAVHKIRAVVRV